MEVRPKGGRGLYARRGFMGRVVVKSRVGADGVLHLALPLGPADANREVQVTVEPVGPPALSQEEWRRFVMETAGKWQGPFERPDQGEYERREPLS
jgi:hypothetical protein